MNKTDILLNYDSQFMTYSKGNHFHTKNCIKPPVNKQILNIALKSRSRLGKLTDNMTGALSKFFLPLLCFGRQKI